MHNTYMSRADATRPQQSRRRSLVADLERSSRVFGAITTQVLDRLDAPLSQAGLRALLVLDDVDGCVLSELSHRVPLSQSATSRMVDRLASAKLVRRTADADDRRQVHVSLTAKGRELAALLIGRRHQLIDAVTAGMDADDLDALRRGLTAFAAAASSRPLDDS